MNKTDTLFPDEATHRFILSHRTDDVRCLALKQAGQQGVNMSVALTQIAGWQTARHKLPSWARREELLYPSHLSMEQCSSEVTARYKCSVLSACAGSKESLTDLTGGFGVDFAFMAAAFRQADYVERSEELCRLAAHNFAVLGLDTVGVHCADAVRYLEEMRPCDWLFIDPARRDVHGGKVVSVSRCEPDVSALESKLLQKGRHVMVKLSPMLDLTVALDELLHVEQAHVVAVQNECKELLLVLGGKAPQADDVPITCINLSASGDCPLTDAFTFTRRQEREAVCMLARSVNAYLYEPHVSLLKAGAFRCLSARFGVEKLHANSHLYTSAVPVIGFPGRAFRVEGVSGFSKQGLRALLAGVEAANVAVRNFPSTADALRRRLKLRDGGNIYLFATTLSDGGKVLLKCVRL